MIYEVTIPQFQKMLTNLTHILDKGAQYAEAKKIDFEVLLQSRLAPDQFPLMRQIQIACDTAKLGVARLSGKEAPSHEDKEKTLAEIKTRIAQTQTYLKSFSAADFIESATKRITTPRWEGKTLAGQELVIQHVLPNFYFHLTAAYEILRHNGVEVGKKDYLGELPFKMPDQK